VNRRSDPGVKAFTPTAPTRSKFQASTCRHLPSLKSN